MYELSAGPPLEERLLLIRSVKSNKALLLEEVTRPKSVAKLENLIERR